MKRAWLVLVAVVLAMGPGCNGLLIVRDGPRAGELNWLGRVVAWPGGDRIGLTEPVEVEGAWDVETGPVADGEVKE